MFRENNHVYYRTDNSDYNHDIDIPRNKKTKELIEEKESDIRILQYRIKNIEQRKLHNTTVPSDERRLLDYQNKIRKLQNEIKDLKCNPITHKIKHSRRKLSADKIYDYCIDAMEQAKNNNISHLRAEDIAFQLNTPVHLVTQTFDKLNKKGLLSQAVHGLPHDCFRPDDSGWTADVYYIR